MEVVEVLTDFAFTEADMRKFFSFCGEIATIELLFSEDPIETEFRADLTFSSGTNSALLLDKSTYEGHLIKVSLRKRVEELATVDSAAVSTVPVPQAPRPTMLSQIKQRTLDMNKKYDIVNKSKTVVLFIPKLLLKPCTKKTGAKQTIQDVEAPEETVNGNQ
ncbi:Hypothetical_protein [Hexamita inflata]|uniref:Hypothetical_protein n=1 Tax=Hexamita inflata TaxID=28002 RepID=A0AA86ULR5_9EUKA|nr:Hypothetical protein HINF_LOCUS43951 [Hexamita inflata]